MTAPRPALERFEQALQGLPAPALRGPEMLPTRLAQACAAALPVDGAALSLHPIDRPRTPIGSSDPSVGHAERLQFTLGVGPCLRAHDDGIRIAFDQADIAANWPELHAGLIAETPYRGVLAVPLLPPLGPLVVLDLYVRDPAALERTDRDDVDEVVIALTRVLVAALTTPAVEGRPEWWQGPEAVRRAQVWQAVGLLDVALSLTPDDALATLQAHAVRTGRLVDEVAGDLLVGHLGPADLLGAPAADGGT